MWFLIYNSAWVLSRSYWPLALFDLNSQTIDLSVVKARKSFNGFLLLNEIFNEPPLISYKRERSVKNILVRTIQNSRKAKPGAQEARRPGTLFDTKKRITNQNCSYNFWLKFLSHFKKLKHARGSRAGPSPFFPKFHWNVSMFLKAVNGSSEFSFCLMARKQTNRRKGLDRFQCSLQTRTVPRFQEVDNSMDCI